ncbi:MAG: TIGR01212 family radical SAM protein [Desulfobacteraceae bacterium]|nr:TIGR01212 family radical SAM protein [Desulfobacteraceae bacterium]
MAERRYNDFAAWLRGRYGCRVQKVSLDAGLTCPNRDGTVGTGGCIYCNERGSGTGAHGNGMPVRQQLEEGKRRLAKRYKARKFIAYFQSFSNTYAPLSELRNLYEEALSVEDVVGISVGTRPDCVSEPVLDLLQNKAERAMVWVEYGLQSANDRTLLRINRGHDAATFERAVRLTHGRGIWICAHIILGLPGEDRSDMLDTARWLGDLGVDGVKLHLLYVVSGTPMEALYRSGRYACLEKEEYAEIVCDVLERLPESMVIQRLTGDPHRSELVAPAWAMDKAGTRASIHRILEERNVRQGCRVHA